MTEFRIEGMDMVKGSVRIGRFVNVIIGDKEHNIRSGEKNINLEAVFQAPDERTEVEEDIVYTKDNKRDKAIRVYPSKSEILEEKRTELSVFVGGEESDIYQLVVLQWDKIMEGLQNA